MNILARQIRDKFLNFFQEHHHLKINSASILPKNDPTLLFINSGMAPIKGYFTGEETPDCPRLCNVQPCIRTIDIDEIGDKHHLTSFQMLGSWSINDYFKKEAVELAFKFLTEYLNIPKEKLYATVFAGNKELKLCADEESIDYWKNVGIPEDHIVMCPMEDNFWGPTSMVGPCGPCTEVFYDTGEGEKYIPGGNFDTKKRYIEIWNAGVFMQFNKTAQGTYEKLKFKSVDTGAGLERLAMVLNGKKNVYQTDLLLPIKEKIESEFENLPKERDILILTDHLRTITLILASGTKPSNEGRGYIPRKLIRRCILITTKMNEKNFNFENILEFIIKEYNDMFPEILKNREYILNEFNKEYEQFKKILEFGFLKLEKIKENNITKEKAFELVTTYGLPMDIIKEFAKEHDILVDEKGFDELLKNHKQISKNNQTNINNDNYKSEILDQFSKTEFCGYEHYECKNINVLGVLKGTDLQEETKENESEQIALILEKTCFYAESGGQSADIGKIFNSDFSMQISDVQKSENGVFLHIGTILTGKIKPGDTVSLQVCKSNRENLAQNHTAAHLLHSALKNILDKNVNQAGSKVESNKLRFDFNYEEKLDQEILYKIENKVNEYIRMDAPCDIEIKSLEEAKQEGAMALFSEKYTENVRVVTFAGVSKELCGGLHASRTGEIGLFLILNCESIGKGIRRITALTGQEALNYIQKQNLVLKEATEILKTKPENLLEKIKFTEQKLKANSKTQPKNNAKSCGFIIKETKSGIKYALMAQEEFDKNLREEAFEIAEKINGLTLCIAGTEVKQVVIACSGLMQKNQYKANDTLKNLLKIIGGKGGGNSRIATGGNIQTDVAQIIEAFTETLN